MEHVKSIPKLWGTQSRVSKRPHPISISRILVAFDGSAHSKKAVELGIDLANKWKAEIYLLHVQEEVELYYEGYYEYARGKRISPSSYLDKLDEKLLDPAERMIRAAGVRKVRRLSARGDPADEILRIVKRFKIDLIILGNRGWGKFSRVFMGSVSTKVLNHANCTCITVK